MATRAAPTHIPKRVQRGGWVVAIPTTPNLWCLFDREVVHISNAVTRINVAFSNGALELDHIMRKRFNGKG